MPELARRCAQGTGILLMATFLAVAAQAQAPPQPPSLPDKPPAKPSERQAPPDANPRRLTVHKFNDRKNLWLFGGVALVRGLDFASTKNFRRRGRDEILLTNEVVDNNATFAVIQAAGVATSIGVSYLLHRTGHHKAERVVSIVHISVGGFGVVRNFSLESRPLQPATP